MPAAEGWTVAGCGRPVGQPTAFVGMTFRAQALVLGPGTPSGFALTNSLHATVRMTP